MSKQTTQTVKIETSTEPFSNASEKETLEYLQLDDEELKEFHTIKNEITQHNQEGCEEMKELVSTFDLNITQFTVESIKINKVYRGIIPTVSIEINLEHARIKPLIEAVYALALKQGANTEIEYTVNATNMGRNVKLDIPEVFHKNDKLFYNNPQTRLEALILGKKVKQRIIANPQALANEVKKRFLKRNPQPSETSPMNLKDQLPRGTMASIAKKADVPFNVVSTALTKGDEKNRFVMEAKAIIEAQKTA